VPARRYKRWGRKKTSTYCRPTISRGLFVYHYPNLDNLVVPLVRSTLSGFKLSFGFISGYERMNPINIQSSKLENGEYSDLCYRNRITCCTVTLNLYLLGCQQLIIMYKGCLFATPCSTVCDMTFVQGDVSIVVFMVKKKSLVLHNE
jgi:hypothetical protein